MNNFYGLEDWLFQVMDEATVTQKEELRSKFLSLNNISMKFTNLSNTKLVNLHLIAYPCGPEIKKLKIN